MPQLVFGTNHQISFVSNSQFYEALGFLAKNNGTTSIQWEHNETSGAWGSEGRIHCYKNIASFPIYFSRAFTAGNGSILFRINCNEFIEYIVNTHNFILGYSQNINNIIQTIHSSYLVDFNRGLGL